MCTSQPLIYIYFSGDLPVFGNTRCAEIDESVESAPFEADRDEPAAVIDDHKVMNGKVTDLYVFR